MGGAAAGRGRLGARRVEPAATLEMGETGIVVGTRDVGERTQGCGESEGSAMRRLARTQRCCLGTEERRTAPLGEEKRGGRQRHEAVREEAARLGMGG